MTKLNEQTIEKLESKGFKRWTKNGMDRLYINCESYGVEITRNSKGGIDHVTFNGEGTSNANGYRLINTKCWLDVNTGELHIKSEYKDYENILGNVQSIIDSVM